MIDERSDIHFQPHLAIIVKIFDNSENSIRQEILGITELQSTNSDAIFGKITELSSEFRLDLNKCVAFASDGANVVAGRTNSVFTRMKEKNEHIIQLKCICHSLNLVVQKAFDVLPSSLSFLMKTIPKWFSKSHLRKSEYRKLFTSMNPDSETTRMPFDKYSETRWLARGKVLFFLKNQFKNMNKSL